MIAINDSFWLNSLTYALIISKFRDHPCYIELIDLFHQVSVSNKYMHNIMCAILHKYSMHYKRSLFFYTTYTVYLLYHTTDTMPCAHIHTCIYARIYTHI